MDTLFLRLLSGCGKNILRFYDVDFPSVIARKNGIIENDSTLRDISKEHHFLVPGDLRCMDSVGQNLTQIGFDSNAPTIFYSECVINYLAYSE